MADKFSSTQIYQLRQVISEVLNEKLDLKLDEKLGENYKARFDRIENNTDMACKIAKDTQVSFQTFTGFATV